MIERKITKDIDNWYHNSCTALLIDGARQVRKTTIIENYLKQHLTISFPIVLQYINSVL